MKSTETAAFKRLECNALMKDDMPRPDNLRGKDTRWFDTECRHLQIALIRCHYKHMTDPRDRARAQAVVVALENADSYPVTYSGAPLNQAEQDAVRAARLAVRRKARREAMERAG